MEKKKNKVKSIVEYSVHTWIFKCFLTALGIELVLEMLGRRSIVSGLLFLVRSPLVFLYNVSIIFFTLLFALFLRKRVFGMIIISSVWLICGIVNFVVLGYRVTPFAAIDFLMVGDVLSMLDVYLKKWQQIGLVVLIILFLIGLVFLFIKTPRFEGSRKIKGTMLACVLSWIGISVLTNYNMKHNIISDDFANLGMAYEDYGFAYCFSNSIIDNGISKPDYYNESAMLILKSNLMDLKQHGETKKPNIIVIQLESFFDPNDVIGLSMSKNPVPTFTRLKEEFPSGYLTVPALGAGTANTEFEVLTGLRSSFFGAGEYPYKTTINHTPVESMCSLLKKQGYGAYAIHNNVGSFYDRENVYDEMGFDAFISLEYMYDVEYTSTGWAKDKTLVDDIMKCLQDTPTRPDLVYTISVQGHGQYPSEPDSCVDHIQITYDDKEVEPKFHYYVNQIYEMDQMIDNLIGMLDAYGEEYVLVLYGDHLPTLDLTEERLPNSTMFQTEYIIVNNINLKLMDRDIMSYELSTRLFQALNMPDGYAQKIQRLYHGKERDEKLELYAYDMLFGECYMYNGRRPLLENHMQRGVDIITVTGVENRSGRVYVYGENFNEFSTIYVDDELTKTNYIDQNTLMIVDETLDAGTKITVKQVDESKHILSESNIFIFE
ncbi:MAG: LTA synthase family protein [Lachnospiraceae bacterium]|nr:LTA synthase family protein [Lachnospiraceae bacterium]